MKKYLVTGVSRGLGLAVAELLLKDGHTVYGTYNSNAEPANTLAEKFQNLSVLKLDLSDQTSISTLVSTLKEVQLDGIVNCAGIFQDIDFEDLDTEAFENTFKVNAFAPLYVVNGLKNNLVDGASIVNIASNDAFVGSIVGIAYSASKATLISITKSLANILAKQKIRVNAVAPGWMGDGMQAPPELLKIAQEQNPLRKIGTYEEIANVVTFLLSDKSSYVNGETITVDGGDMATNYILQQEAELL